MADDQEQKPKLEGDDKQINIKIKDQDGVEVHFKVKRTTKFSKIMGAYCSKKSIATDQVRFLFDGTRLNGEQTPEDLDLEDGDCLEAMQQQVGGC